MKIAICLLLIGTILCVSALPASTKDKKPVKKSCGETCPDTEKIICAKGSGYTFAFINECVLAKSNCENNREMVKISDGMCPGKTGVRLS